MYEKNFSVTVQCIFRRYCKSKVTERATEVGDTRLKEVEECGNVSRVLDTSTVTDRNNIIIRYYFTVRYIVLKTTN